MIFNDKKLVYSFFETVIDTNMKQIENCMENGEVYL